MTSKWFAVMVVLSAGAAFAQGSDFSPPPMVPATPPPTPAPDPNAVLVPPPPPTPAPATPPAAAPAPLQSAPGTPPPPSSLPPPGYVPGQPGTGYPYSPYGSPQPRDEKPPVEWGLMISESLFGQLTAAGIALIPYFLLLRPMVYGQGGVIGNDTAVNTVIFVVIFAAVPLAVSQTESSIANGSRFFTSETWIPMLSGLATEGAVLGLFFLTRGGHLTDLPMDGGNELLLLIGTIGVVPLVQMAMINLFKSPKMGRMAAITRDRSGKIALGMPALAPIVGNTRAGFAVGMQASLVNLSF